MTRSKAIPTVTGHESDVDEYKTTVANKAESIALCDIAAEPLRALGARLRPGETIHLAASSGLGVHVSCQHKMRQPTPERLDELEAADPVAYARMVDDHETLTAHVYALMDALAPWPGAFEAAIDAGTVKHTRRPRKEFRAIAHEMAERGVPAADVALSLVEAFASKPMVQTERTPRKKQA